MLGLSSVYFFGSLLLKLYIFLRNDEGDFKDGKQFAIAEKKS
jgi:hypothetical protein